MKLYLFGTEDGKWYAGRTPAGRIKEVSDYTEAVLFTENTKDDAEYCIELGYGMYSIEVSQPKLETPGSSGSKAPGSGDKTSSFKEWELHPMDLFGGSR